MQNQLFSERRVFKRF